MHINGIPYMFHQISERGVIFAPPSTSGQSNSIGSDAVAPFCLLQLFVAVAGAGSVINTHVCRFVCTEWTENACDRFGSSIFQSAN